MISLVSEATVFERTSGMPGKPKRTDASAKIDSAIHRKAGLVARYRGIPIAEYLSSLLAAPVQRDYDRMRENMEHEDPEQED
jgi:hypothetical protein